METNGKRSIPGLSVDTKMLQDRLRDLKDGEIATYEELSSLVGRDVTASARGNLNSARNRLLNEGIAIVCVHGQGVKRASDAEKIGTGLAYMKRIRRGARKTGKIVAAVDDFDSLSKDLQVQHNLTLSVLGVVGHMTKATTIKQLEARIDQAKKSLPIAKTLEAMK